MEKFEENPNLGIASGSLYYTDHKKTIIERGPDYFPRGPVRMWRKKCFLETDMYKVTYCPDSVSCIKARLSGWETKCFKEITGLHRRTSSATGLWAGYRIRGEGHYFLNFNPLFIMGKGIYLSFREPYYIGLAFCYGYFSKLVKLAPKIDDKQIKDYYWRVRFNEKATEILSNLLKINKNERI